MKEKKVTQKNAAQEDFAKEAEVIRQMEERLDRKKQRLIRKKMDEKGQQNEEYLKLKQDLKECGNKLHMQKIRVTRGDFSVRKSEERLTAARQKLEKYEQRRDELAKEYEKIQSKITRIEEDIVKNIN